jgi:hypothetical protein
MVTKKFQSQNPIVTKKISCDDQKNLIANCVVTKKIQSLILWQLNPFSIIKHNGGNPNVILFFA